MDAPSVNQGGGNGGSGVNYICYHGLIGDQVNGNNLEYGGFGTRLAYGSVEAAQQIPIAQDGTLKAFVINVRTNSLNTTATITVRINGVDTALTLNVLVGETGSREVIADVAVNRGDLLNILVNTQPVGGGNINTPGFVLLQEVDELT